MKVNKSNNSYSVTNTSDRIIKPPVDIGCTIRDAEVYASGSDVYSCALTYTDVRANSNKFYIIQIICLPSRINPTNYGLPINGTCPYALFTKYGRTGENGTSNLKWCNTSQQAITLFKKQYKSKTGNPWGVLTPQPYKYYHLLTKNEPDSTEEEPTTTASSTTASSTEPLNEKVSEFVTLISNTNLHLQAMRAFGVDTRKMPLGKISDVVITEANGILYAISEIVKAINDGTWEESKNMLDLEDRTINNIICDLSNSFWVRIPYNCGRTKPPIIDAIAQVEKCADLIDLMKNSKVANTIVKRSKTINDIYDSLNTTVSVCDNLSEVTYITQFVNGTKAPTHNYRLKVEEVYYIRKKCGSDESDNLFRKTPNHMLLAHGSKVTNFMGILSEGLRIPKESQVSNGAILGRGIYFADVISKSFNYCNAYETNNIGYVLLCEVALGDKYDDCETVVPYDRVNLPKEYTCRRGLGKTDVDKSKYVEYEIDGSAVTVPQGPLIPRNGLSSLSSFLYNEYVIFDTRLYRFRYLVKIKSI